MTNKPFFRQITLCFLVVVLLHGCALPNLKPFADATAELHTAVLKTDTNVRLTLVEAGASDQADELGKELAVRIAAMNAVVNYTDALAHIADAGRTGSENGGKVASSLNGFLDALSVDSLPTNYVAMAKSLYGIVAQVRAAYSFSSAVEKADPAIQSIAEILIDDFDALEILVRQAREPVKTKLLQQENNRKVYDYRSALDKRRRKLEGELSAGLNDASKIAELKKINGLIEMTKDRYEPLQAQLEAINARTNLQISLVRKARDGVEQWAKIHKALARAVKNGLPPNTRLLASTVIEIRELIKEEASK